MKKIALAIVLLPLLATAQKNTLKVNLSSLIAKNYHVTYERKLSKRTSFSLGFRYMPNGEVPFQDQFEKIIDDPDVNIGRYRMGNTAITPEFRFYMSRKGQRGFYIAPYGRYASFNMTVPIKYSSTTVLGTVKKDADFEGTITSISGGLMFGVQYPISKHFVLDIWLIGAHYGSSSGDLNVNFNPKLNNTPPNDEVSSLRTELNSLKPEPFKITSTVANDGSSAQIKSDGPWAGVRGLGINIGFRF